MSRFLRTVGVLASATAIGFAVAACGSEQEAPAASSTASAVPSAASPSGADSSTPGSASAPVVGGPRPQPNQAGTESPAAGTCGLTKGPDGSLTIVITGGTVTCGDAKKIADEYGPKIATGKPQTVSGWQCGPDDSGNYLAHCTKGSDSFGLRAG